MQVSETEQPKKKADARKWATRTLAAAALIAAGIYGAPKLFYALTHESTDDAFVTGTVVPVSSEVKGRVTRVYIDDNQYVKAGAPLLEIYCEDYANAVREKQGNRLTLAAQTAEIQSSIDEKKKALLRTKANLAAALADEVLAAKELKRNEELIREALISQSRYDRVETQWKSAQAALDAARAAVAEAEASLSTLYARLKTQGARVSEAEASLDTARLDLRRTVLVAPVSGRIAKKNVDPGKYIQAGQSLLALVDDTHVWVIANFKETQIKKMKQGQPVRIEVDAYPGIDFKGHVDSFQPGTGSVFSLLPPENATGNFVKVIQRMPVKILIDTPVDTAHPLRPGLSVVPSVDVRS
jgi:membrane fusion protein (multidrug efflux system)